MTEEQLRELPGLVATVVTTGAVDDLFASFHEEMRAWNLTNGYGRVEYRRVPAVLVEAGRDSCVLHALQHGYAWLLQIDADAAPFPPDALHRLLVDAYVRIPDADVVGAYAQLKGSYICTIDTGTGTWEEHYPGEGILPVIRTGGHFHLTKAQAYRRFGPPWYRSRSVITPVRAMAELDNFARMRLGGRNPFSAVPEWEPLLAEAKRTSAPAAAPQNVGEDSSFCDALVAAGGRIYVDTDLPVGHVGKEVIGPQKLKEAIAARDRQIRLACGVLE